MISITLHKYLALHSKTSNSYQPKLQPTQMAPQHHLLDITPHKTQYHFPILNSATQWLVGHSKNGTLPMALQWIHGSSYPQQPFLIWTVTVCFYLMVSAVMLWMAYAVLPGSRILFCQSLLHPMSTFYSTICHNFSDVLPSVIPHPSIDNNDAPAELAVYHPSMNSPVNVTTDVFTNSVVGCGSGVELTYWCTTWCMANYWTNDGVLHWMQETL